MAAEVEALAAMQRNRERAFDAAAAAAQPGQQQADAQVALAAAPGAAPPPQQPAPQQPGPPVQGLQRVAVDGEDVAQRRIAELRGAKPATGTDPAGLELRGLARRYTGVNVQDYFREERSVPVDELPRGYYEYQRPQVAEEQTPDWAERV